MQGLTSVTSRNEFPLGLWGKRTIEMEDCAQDAAERDNGTEELLKERHAYGRMQGRMPWHRFWTLPENGFPCGRILRSITP